MDAACVKLRWSDGGQPREVADLEDVSSLPTALKDKQVQELKDVSFIVELPSYGEVAGSYEQRQQALEKRVEKLEKLEGRVGFLEANSDAYLKIVRRFLVAAVREKLVQRAGLDAAHAAARWNDCLNSIVADKHLWSTCGLSLRALSLTERGRGTETDAGNIAAHEIPQATVQAAIDDLPRDDKGPWGELFNLVYSSTARS